MAVNDEHRLGDYLAFPTVGVQDAMAAGPVDQTGDADCGWSWGRKLVSWVHVVRGVTPPW